MEQHGRGERTLPAATELAHNVGNDTRTAWVSPRQETTIPKGKIGDRVVHWKPQWLPISEINRIGGIDITPDELKAFQDKFRPRPQLTTPANPTAPMDTHNEYGTQIPTSALVANSDVFCHLGAAVRDGQWRSAGRHESAVMAVLYWVRGRDRQRPSGQGTKRVWALVAFLLNILEHCPSAAYLERAEEGTTRVRCRRRWEVLRRGHQERRLPAATGNTHARG